MKKWYKGVVNIHPRIEEGKLILDMKELTNKEAQEMENKFVVEECNAYSSDDSLLNTHYKGL